MKLVIPVAALAALFPLVPVVAESPAATTPRQEVVRFGDLAVASPGGRAALDRRIGRAAETVCGAASDLDLAGQNAVRRCRDATIAATEVQLAQTLAAGRATLTVAAR